jgi:Flp pilus assembly protein TadD
VAVALLLGLVCVSPAPGRVLMVVFPLANQDTVHSELLEWGRYAVAECFSRNSRYVRELQVWDPAFLCSADTSVRDLSSDSLLALHHQRWKWDIAVGGSIASSGDSLLITLRAVRYVDGKPARRQLQAAGRSAIGVTSRLYAELLGALGGAVPPQATQPRAATESDLAYRTYVAGYGFELRRNYSAAASAYTRALELDGRLSFAAVRLANIYALRRDFTAASTWMHHAALRSSSDPVVAGMSALYLVQFDDPGKAAEYIQAHTGLLDQTAEGLAAQGMLYSLLGQYDRAVALLTQAVAFGPSDLETDLALGRAYLAAGDFTMAADVFNRLVAFRPDCLRYYSFLGAAYRSQGRLMESERVLAAAYRLSSDDVPLLVNLASTRFALGRYDEAERLLLHARELNPFLIEVAVNLAVVYWQLGKQREARALLTTARRSRKDRQATLSAEAGFLVSEGKTREALGRFREAEHAGRKNEQVLNNLGLLCADLGRLSEAAAWYDELLRLTPNRLDVLVRQADIQARRGDLAGAESSCRRILQLSPHNEEAIRRLAAVLEQQERPTEAVTVIERHLADFPSDVALRVAVADIYRRMGWYEVAAMHLEQAVRDFPGHYAAEIDLGRTLYDLIVHKNSRQFDKAIAVLKRASVMAPADPEPEYLLGRIYLDCTREGELGREYLNRALAHASDAAMRRSIEGALAGKSN